MYLLWNQYLDGPAKTVGAIASEAMLAIALAVIAVGNNDGNSGSGGSSGGSVGGGGCGEVWCKPGWGSGLHPNPTLRLKKRRVFTFGALIAS